MWFIVPGLHVPEMSLIYAVPISGLVSLLTFEKIGESEKISDSWIEVGRWAIGATVFLASAFLIHLIGP
jgi:hypothetical protein